MQAKALDAERDLINSDEEGVIRKLHRVQVLREVMRLPQKIILTR